MKTKKPLIERTFLLLERPEIKKGPGRHVEIEQGYIVAHPSRELRLRRQGSKYFISSREKLQDATSCKELPLTKKFFDALWPFTQGARISFQRRALIMEGVKARIDSFLGEHAPLQIMTLYFSTAAQSKEFEKPSFLGEEITWREEYNALEMSLYGVPEEMGVCQIGILPYIFRDQKLYVLLITNSSGTRWILPKGRQEPDMTPAEVALMEAVEEGGVLGTIRHDLRVRCSMANGRLLQLYAMKISKLLRTWPEENFRLRRLMPINEALTMIEDRGVVHGIKRLVTQIKKQQ
ncbi:MAG: hypothetical protein K2W99_01535 [Chthoniobacterales bacterium]|nr:hypothetical protein [Chthoniobacterales bacterium]